MKWKTIEEGAKAPFLLLRSGISVRHQANRLRVSLYEPINGHHSTANA
ncbi:hypothetical protein [Undibacterium sp. WLX3042]